MVVEEKAERPYDIITYISENSTSKKTKRSRELSLGEPSHVKCEKKNPVTRFEILNIQRIIFSHLSITIPLQYLTPFTILRLCRREIDAIHDAVCGI